MLRIIFLGAVVAVVTIAAPIKRSGSVDGRGLHGKSYDRCTGARR